MQTLLAINSVDLEEIRTTNRLILEKLNSLASQPEFLTRKKFLAEAPMGATKFWELVKAGKLRTKRTGPRTIMVPYSELLRFQRGEMD